MDALRLHEALDALLDLFSVLFRGSQEVRKIHDGQSHLLLPRLYLEIAWIVYLYRKECSGSETSASLESS